MQVRILPFGILKESLGSDAFALDLPGGATVADLLARVAVQAPAVESLGIAVSVNAEYAERSLVLSENDEVGLLPPVSGGSGANDQIQKEKQPTVSQLTREPIQPMPWSSAAKQGEDGAVIVFDGIVRNNSRGRQTLYLDYEAYEEMATKQMNELAREGDYPLRRSPRLHRSSSRPSPGRRNQRAHHRRFCPSRAGLRSQPLAHRHAQKNSSHLEKRNLCGRSGMGRWRALSAGIRRGGRQWPCGVSARETPALKGHDFSRAGTLVRSFGL